ncbi:MAG TPA: ASCH domain-containing protein [Oscillospiraceae bacterium]|nr:ASCH domain-containing protein [Oscillospiraceae bacterium]
MKILLSIKPEYAQKIFQGEKKYEYRKRLFKRDDISSIIVYVTKPVGRVVGEFEIAEIIEDNPMAIWQKTKQYSGISQKEYFKYFEGNEKGFAISIQNITTYQKPLTLRELNPNIKSPPQSFAYIRGGTIC